MYVCVYIPLFTGPIAEVKPTRHAFGVQHRTERLSEAGALRSGRRVVYHAA